MKRSVVAFGHFAVAIALLTIAPFAFGQEVNPGTESGLPPFGSFSGSSFDHVNIQNGAVHIEIPIVSVKERGETFAWNLIYDTPQWSKIFFLQPTQRNPYAGQYNIEGPVSGGWQLRGPFDWQVQEIIVNGATCALNNKPYNYESEFELIDPHGTPHQLPLRVESGFIPPQTSCLGSTLSGPTLDGTGITYNSTTNLITLKDGTQIRPGNMIQDTNGNEANGIGTLAGPTDLSPEPVAGSIKDMYGRQLITASQGSLTPYTSPLGHVVKGAAYTLFEVTDSTGTQQTYRVDYEAVDFKTSLCGLSNPCSEASGTLLQPKQLTLPNGKTYIFSYNNNTYFDLSSVTLPTAGSISYTFSGPALYTQPGPGGKIPPNYFGVRYVSTRTVNDNGTPLTWQYNGIGTVTLPTGDIEVHTFGEVVIGSNFSPELVEQSVAYENSAGTVLKTVATAWTGALDAMNGGVKNLQPIRETTTLDSGLVTKTETDYETFQYTCAGSALCPGTATRLNPTEKREFAYASGAPGALMRKTDYTYLHNNSTNGTTYQNLNIVDRVSTAILYDANSNIISQKSAEYDNYTSGISASGAIQRNSSYGTSYITRGNITAAEQWRNTDGAWLLTRFQFDDAGNVLSATDPLSNTTQYDYTDNWTTQTGGTACEPTSGQTKGYLTKITNALTQVTKRAYFSCTGLSGSSTDPNTLTTSQSYDLFERPLITSYPNGGQTTKTYDDTNLLVTTAKLIQTGKSVYTVDHFDQIGQHVEHDLCEDGTASCSSPISIKFTYDGKARLISKTNPCRSIPDSSCGTTQYQYDSIDRQSLVIPPDGSSSGDNVKTAYCNNSVLVTDEAGKWRRSTTDALGRLIEIDEPNSLTASVGVCPTQGDPILVSTYGYDLLDNATSVMQNGSRQRTFVYNSLSRLLTATNPESGTTTYTYDNDENLLTEQDARSITTTHFYDPLNRLTKKTYSNGDPTITYSYDVTACLGLPHCANIGHRTGMTDAAGSESWAYDVVDRETTDQRTTNQTPETTTYTYNFDDSLATEVYPSGHTITYTPDAAGRPVSAIDTASGINYATAAQYAPGGALASLTNGANLTSTIYYDKRIQPCRISIKSSGTAPTQCSDSTNIGNVLDFTYSFSLGAADNGDVTSVTNNRDTTRSQTFTYDQFNRLLAAATTSTFATSPTHCWGESYVYDNQASGGPWGTLTNINSVSSAYTGCTQESLSVMAAPNNQISGYCYDAAGNLLAQSAPPCPTPTYTYNAENQMTATAGVTYTYDGDGRRVSKSNGTLYWYGRGTDPIMETDSSGNLKDEYIFFAGKRVARRDSSSSVDYYFSDHLDTARIVVSSSGAILDDSDFYPFGGERDVQSSSGNHYKFTGKERDAESNLDNFGARYDASSLGRFMSPDIGPFHFDNPQSFNRYAYALNNPLFYVDPDGEDSVSGIYQLGTASVHTFVESGQNVDPAALLGSLGGTGSVSLSDMQRDQSMIPGGSGTFSRYIPFPNAGGGGCVLGCITVFDVVPVAVSLSLSFNYDDKTGQVMSANIEPSIDVSAPFVGPNPRAQQVAFQGLPGITPGPEVFSVNIDSGVLQKLTTAQVAALDKATAGKNDPISQAIQKAILAEERRRADQEKRKEKQKTKCAGTKEQCSPRI